jgi:REP element-mobilizing transposase RayT
MPWGLERWRGGHDLHFLTFCCYHRQPLLAGASRRDLFVKVLEQVRRRYHWVVLGYVVMPEHIHLLVSEPPHHRLSNRNPGAEARLRTPRAGRATQTSPEFTERSVRAQHAARLAGPILRLQRLHRSQAGREATLHASQPCEARLGGSAGAMALEQLSLVCLPGTGASQAE